MDEKQSGSDKTQSTNETATHPSLATTTREDLRRRVEALWRAAEQGIFISYSRADEVFAVGLATNLREAGADVWMDMLEMPDEGADWDAVVTEALRRCGVMLAILSPSALKDRAVRAEWRGFVASGKPVQPIIAVRCDLSKLTFALAPLNFALDYDNGLHRLSTVLRIDNAKR